MLWNLRRWLGKVEKSFQGKTHRTAKPPRRKVTLEIEPLERRFLLTTVGFSTTSPSVVETAGNATVTVTLDASSSSTITVDYTTSIGGSATAGTDYNTVSGTLTFSPGDTSKTFKVPITDSDSTTTDKTVNLALSNATNATIGLMSGNATLTINHTTPTNWLPTGDQYTKDAVQGCNCGSGIVDLNPQTGAVQVSHSFDLGLSGGSGETALVYDSSSVDVHPILNATFPSEATDPVPSSISVQLSTQFNHINHTQSAVTYSTSGHSAGDKYAFAAQVDSAVSTTGTFAWSLHIIASFSTRGNIDRTVSGTTWAVVNDGTDAFGKGWSLAGLDRLVISTAGLLWVKGSAGARYFPSAGGSSYTSGSSIFD